MNTVPIYLCLVAVEGAARRRPWFVRLCRHSGRVAAGALTLCSCLGLAAGAAPTTGKPAATDPKTQVYVQTVQPLLDKYCYNCHGDGEHKGDVALDSYQTAADVIKGKSVWETVLHHINTQEMPPATVAHRPDIAEREQISDWIEKTLYNYDPAKPDPGRVTIHRLNRNEYHNTIRDLVGVDFQPTYDFPGDNSGYGFDNVSDVLSLSPTLMQDYLAAADQIFDEAITTDPIPSKVQHFAANLMEFGFNADGDKGDGWMPLSPLEEDGLAMTLPVSGGEYLVRVQAYSRNARGGPGAPVFLTAMIDDTITHVWTVTATNQDAPGVYEARMSIPPGKHRVFVLNHRIRGGENELHMENGRIGAKQPGFIMAKWVELEGPLPNTTSRYPVKDLAIQGEGRFNAAGQRILDHNGEVAVKFNVPKAGDYILRAEAYAQQAGADPAKMEFHLDGQTVQSFNVIAPATRTPTAGQRIFSTVLLEAQPQMYEFQLKLTPGEKRFAAAFVNDFTDPGNADPNLRKRSLILDHLEVVSLDEPPPPPAMPPQIKSLFDAAKLAAGSKPHAEAQMAHQIVTEFANRAWRRPADPAQVDHILSLFTNAQNDGLSFEASVKLPLKAVLVSPNFLFRGEVQPDPDNPESVYPVDEYALASRLSYFLWSSMPDEELTGLAAHKQLRSHLDAQVKRMLASPKAQAFVENFSGQWLETRNLKFVEPDKFMYPDFDENLRVDMGRETELFFGSIMHEDRSVMDFLNADYTFVNNRLARLYGMTNVLGDDFQRVSLEGTPRRGVLTEAAVLTVTSNPTRTSPVKRGKWVLEELLGTPPPPPPPVIPELKNDGQPVAGTLRQQMEEHRADPVCASCHARMDPIGFGLENFDGIGRWRDAERLVERPVDKPFVDPALRALARANASKGVITFDDDDAFGNVNKPEVNTNAPAKATPDANAVATADAAKPDANTPLAADAPKPDAGALAAAAFPDANAKPDGDAPKPADAPKAESKSFPIDASGKLVSGESFKGAADLADILANSKRDFFVRCLTEKMLTYALGRGTEYYDRAAIEKITKDMAKNQYKFSSLVLGVVDSLPFQMRRGEGEHLAANETTAADKQKNIATR